MCYLSSVSGSPRTPKTTWVNTVRQASNAALIYSCAFLFFCLQRCSSKRSIGHVLCGSGGFTSVVIVTFCLLKYSMTLRRKTCDRVKSCSAQIASTVARIVFGILKAVAGSDSFNVILLVVDNGIYDIVSLNLCSGNETGRKFNTEI